MDTEVMASFSALPNDVRNILLAVRELIFDCATQTHEIGTIQEVLRWGQPSYITPVTKAGSLIRLGQSKTGAAALFVHCQTTLVSEFKHAFPNDFVFEGNRAIQIDDLSSEKVEKLKLIITRALTYHLHKGGPRARANRNEMDA